MISPSDFAKIFNDVAGYPYLRDVAHKTGLSVRQVRSMAARLRMAHANGEEGAVMVISRENRAGHAAPEAGIEHREITTVLPSKDEPIEQLLERAMKANDKYQAHAAARECIDIKIKVEGPIAVVGIPDPHLNNRGCLLRRALMEATAIATTPGVFAVGIGDWLDNFIIGRLERERRKDIMTHSDANRIQDHYVTTLAPKLIAAIGGNHNDWIEQLGGIDALGKLFEELGLGPIYHPDEVRVRLTCPNGAQFMHLARHKFPGKSDFHATHGILKWLLQRWMGEDVAWGGHIHSASHMAIQRDYISVGGTKISKVAHAIQLPAYKAVDGYAMKEGFRENVPFIAPMVIHDPANGKTEFFSDFDWGLSTLKTMRKMRGLEY